MPGNLADLHPREGEATVLFWRGGVVEGRGVDSRGRAAGQGEEWVAE